MKKLLAILLTLVLLISCGKEKKDNKSLVDSGKTGSTSNKNTESADELKRYNNYVNIYNEILMVDKNLRSYFEDAGIKEALNKNERISIIPISSHLVNTLKKNLETSKNEEIDNIAKELLPVLEEMKPITEEMDNYYKSKDYTSDNYVKGEQLHKKLLAILPKYDEISRKYKDAVKKKTEEQKVKDMERMKKEGRVIGYNIMSYIKVSEKILDEIDRQKLNAANFTEADLTKFKELQQELIKISDELQKITTPEQLKKEGYNEALFSSFKGEVNDFKATVATFIERVEKKEKSKNLDMNDSFFLETEEGTPENVYRKFNELINSYNSLI